MKNSFKLAVVAIAVAVTAAACGGDAKKTVIDSTTVDSSVTKKVTIDSTKTDTVTKVDTVKVDSTKK